MKEEGFDLIFEQFIKEILILESDERMLLNISHRPGFLIHGNLATFCADTKGAHKIGGFMSPSATRFFRVCEISRNDFRDHGTTDNVVLRSKDSINDQVQHALDYVPGGDASTGIKGSCPLNKSNFFHIGENLIFDCMHDIPEGTGPFFLKICLREWNINKKEYGLTAEFLNERIVSFHYGRYDSTNKPSPRFTDANLREKGNYSTKQRASQNMCLLRNFPLLFGDKIPEDDPHYQFLLLFLSICDIIFSPAITIAHCNILKEKISELFEKFNILFSDIQPINKMHHLTHYPDMMKMHGPPTRYWCMRFESYHYILKRRAQFIGNFINICKSLACHVQRFNCLNLVENEILRPKIVLGPLKSKSLDLDVPFEPSEFYSVPSWIQLGGWDYRPGIIVVLKKSFETESGLPKFARITNIIAQNDSQFFLALSVLKTIYFDTQYHSYLVEERTCEKKIVLNILECCSVEPLDLVQNFSADSNKYYVNPRHII